VLGPSKPQILSMKLRKILQIILLPVAVFAAPEEASRVVEPAGALTLQRALALALEQSPELAAFNLEIRAAEARVVQARLRPNPDLIVTGEDFLGQGDFQGVDQSQLTLQLSQIIELGGKRRARSGVAMAARERSLAEYEVKRVEVLAGVTERFIEVVAHQEELALAREARALAEDSLGAARKRVEAGRGSPLEEQRVAVALARAKIEEEHLEHELLTDRRRLAAFWGSDAPTFKEARANLFAHRTAPSLDFLEARVANGPEGLRWVSEKRLREAELKLALTRRTPNLTLGGGVRYLATSEDLAYVMQFSLPLPISDRNQGAIAEARALDSKAVIDRRANELRLRATLFGLYQEMLHSIKELEVIRREILPGAQESLRLARDGFAEGKFSQLELLDAQRTLVEVKKQNITAASNYHRYVLEIEKLLGAPLHSAEPPSSPSSK
jgi:cobalt-zinc-cadmium efflux system outer membrane protein